MSTLREYSYKIKGLKDVSEATIDEIKQEFSLISGVIAFNVDKDNETVDYALDQWSSDYDAFSKISEICEKRNLELVFDEDEVVETEVEEEQITIAEEDTFEEEEKVVKNKLTRADIIEKGILAVLALAFLGVGALLNKFPNVQPWILMLGFTVASYEVLYEVVVKATEKVYVAEEIITFFGALVLTYLGYTAIATVIMILYSSLCFSVSYAKHKIAIKKEKLTEKINSCEDEDVKKALNEKLSFIEEKENAYSSKLCNLNQKRLVLNLSFVGLAILAIFVPPFFTIKSYWSALANKWLYLGASILVLSGFGEVLFSNAHTELLAVLKAYDNGVTVNSLNKLLKLTSKDTVVFDKAGVLTEDAKVVSVEGEERTLLLALTAVNGLEGHVANAVKLYAKDLTELEAVNVDVTPNMGVSYNVDGESVLVGNKRFLKEKSIITEELKDGCSHLYVCVNGNLIGYLTLSVEVYDDSFGAIAEIKNDLGLKTELLSADEGDVVVNVKKSLQLDKAISGASPKFKADKINELNAVYVANEINDKETLALVEDAIAFGNNSSISITNKSIRKVPFILKLAKRTEKILSFNKKFPIASKAFLIALAIALRVFTSLNFIWWVFALDVLSRGLTVVRAMLNSSDPA